MNRYELTPQHDSRKSFYGKATVFVTSPEGGKSLQSYSTRVARVEVDERGERVAVVKGVYSPTTLRHIKEFLKQEGFRAESKSQILADYLR